MPNCIRQQGIDLIVANAKKYADTVVVTGGEPLTWDMTLLTQKLKNQNLKVHIETSGAYKLTGEWDWICLSPKKKQTTNTNCLRPSSRAQSNNL